MSKKIKVTQIKSAIGRNGNQEKILIGLGLRGVNKESLLLDTPAIRGMIFKVKHLVKVEEEV